MKSLAAAIIKKDKLVKIAESHGWGNGKHIDVMLDIKQLYDYANLCGYIDGMRRARSLRGCETRKSLTPLLSRKP